VFFSFLHGCADVFCATVVWRSFALYWGVSALSLLIRLFYSITLLGRAYFTLTGVFFPNPVALALAFRLGFYQGA